MSWFDQATAWHWWVLGAIFVILEIFSPAAFFLWLGIAAGLVGFILLAVPELQWEYQLLAFAIFSLVSILLSKRYFHYHPIKTDQPKLNRRGEQYIDRVFTLEEPVINGYGKIRVNDSTWKVEGEDCPAGTKVIITGVDGVVLQMEPLSATIKDTSGIKDV
jgi:membrane protein implicated in regulation of membrane protease activity